jgi:hypothetical protein
MNVGLDALDCTRSLVGRGRSHLDYSAGTCNRGYIECNVKTKRVGDNGVDLLSKALSIQPLQPSW